VIRPLPDPALEAPQHSLSEPPPATVSEIASWLVGHTLDEVERELIVHTIENCGGDRVLAASVLGLSMPAMRRKMTAYAVRGQPIPEIVAAEPAVKEEAAHANETESRATTQVPLADNDSEPNLPAVAQPAAVAEPVQQPEITQPAVVAEPVKQPEKTKSNVRLLLAGAAAAALIVPLALRMTGETQPRADLPLPERPRIEVTAVERPQALEQRIPVPVWNGSAPLRMEPGSFVDIAADKRAEAAAKASALEAIRTVVNFDSEQDTIMEPAVPSLTATGPLASSDISADTRMEPAPAAAPSRAVTDWSAIDIEQDTRMESAAVAQSAASSAEDATGSIGRTPTFVAPADVPEPLERPDIEPREKAANAVKRRSRPAAPAPVAPLAPTAQVPFPFSLLAGSNPPRAVPAAPAPSPTAGVTSAADSSVRN